MKELFFVGIVREEEKKRKKLEDECASMNVHTSIRIKGLREKKNPITESSPLKKKKKKKKNSNSDR